MIEDPGLARCDGIRHGFFDRTGGVSEGPYASLNTGFGSQDRREHIVENRARVAAAFDRQPADLLTLYQVHSSDVVVVRGPDDASGRKADAMVTDRPGLVLGVLTADCAPVLLADPQAGIVGAAHAGWLGAIRGVVDRAVEAMVALGARRERTVAAVGPAIAWPSYEIGPEFHRRFLDDDSANARFFVPSQRRGHHRFDLPGYVRRRLAACGIDRQSWTGGDTCAEDERFFSYRRSTLRGEPDYGRQISAICLHDGPC